MHRMPSGLLGTHAQHEQFDPKHKEWRGKFSNSTADNEPVTFVTWQWPREHSYWEERSSLELLRITPNAVDLGGGAQDQAVAHEGGGSQAHFLE